MSFPVPCDLTLAPGWRAPRLAAVALGVLLSQGSARNQNPVDSALSALLGNNPTTVAFNLDRLRPAAIPAEFRNRVLRSLPVEDRITKLRPEQQAKLASLEPVLRLQERLGVYEFPVYRHPRAHVGLAFGAAILLSEEALNLLTSDELQALVAHEIGHEYVWGPYQAAEKRQDYRRLKELELYCDGVAILTLQRVGADPNHLLTVLEKLYRFNRVKSGPPDNDLAYPSMDQRKRFARAVMRISSGR